MRKRLVKPVQFDYLRLKFLLCVEEKIRENDINRSGSVDWIQEVKNKNSIASVLRRSLLFHYHFLQISVSFSYRPPPQQRSSSSSDPENILDEPEEKIKIWPHCFSRILAASCCTLGLFNISRFSVLSIYFGGKNHFIFSRKPTHITT